MTGHQGPQFDVVVPSLGRPSLAVLLASLAGQQGPRPSEVVVVDDRPDGLPPLTTPAPMPSPLRVLRGFGHGPAAARNLGWRVTTAPWVVFLDDDVVLPPGWAKALARDLVVAGPRQAGGPARRHGPPPPDRPPPRAPATIGLESSAWITADMAYRREALREVAGFDERFPRAYREDADLAARLLQRGWQLCRGERVAEHPLRPAPGWFASVRAQRGNADDALFRRLHGRRWREVAGIHRGRLAWHVLTCLSGAVALAAAGGGRRRRPARVVAVAAAAAWAALTADFAARRIRPGPRTPAEVATMAATSILIPPAAVWHRGRGALRHRSAASWPPRPAAVLFDRDGTLVEDVPYNGDPEKVRPTPHAREAVQRLRHHNIRLGVVSNQSGVATGLLAVAQVEAVNAEVDRQLGPFDVWRVCCHGPDDGCACRKPAPGLVLAAARALRVRVQDCVVIGDIASDVMAARAAGARSILVPGPQTLPAEIRDAPLVADDLAAAAGLVLRGVS